MSSASSKRRVLSSCTVTFLLAWAVIIFFVVLYREDYTKFAPEKAVTVEYGANLDTGSFCKDGLVYVYNISEAFNREFVRGCSSFKRGLDLCTYMENGGIGRVFDFEAKQGGQTTSTNRYPSPWHNTWQFAMEVYFHERLVRHACVTDREELATAFFVPYDAGMNLSRRFSRRMVKGELYLKLAKWLQGRESWKRCRGRDHFMVLGRVASDFHRLGGDRAWSNALLRQKVFKGMVVLSIERTPGLLRESGASIGKESAIPYPTYFHAGGSSGEQLRSLVNWICQTSQRVSLVTMAAGHRHASTNKMRDRLMSQCSDDPRCTLFVCVGNEASHGRMPGEMRNVSVPLKVEGGKTLTVPCNNPAILLSAMHQSEFCLQPPGDSPTRRSFFDAMLAGCIPVIFQKEAAWSQYVHHLPENGASYSIYIPTKLAKKKKKVSDILSRVRKSRIREMRANIAKLIPRILYARVNERRSETPRFASNYAAQFAESPDAFDIALDAVLRRIKSNVQLTHNVSLS